MGNQRTTTQSGSWRGIAKTAFCHPPLRSVAHRVFHELGERVECLAHWPSLAGATYRGLYRLNELTAENDTPAGIREPWQPPDEITNLQRLLREALLNTTDQKTARELNTLLSRIEFQRGLGKVASLPTSWAIEGDCLLDHAPVLPYLRRFFAYAKSLILNIRTSEQLSRIAAVRDFLLDNQIKLKFVLHPQALLEGDLVQLFDLAARIASIVLDFGSSRWTPALSEKTRLIASLYSRCDAVEEKPLITWQIALHRENLSNLPSLGLLAAECRPKGIELFFERADTTELVERSLFFARHDAIQLLESFVSSCRMYVNYIRLPWEDSFYSGNSLEGEEVFGRVHVNSAGLVHPCAGATAASIENFLGAWDSSDWAEHRSNVARNCIVHDCYLCQVHARRDVGAVDYLLAAYEKGNPSLEYLNAVRRTLDGVADTTIARELNASIRHFEHSRGLEYLASYPHRMYIEVTDECNLRCPMCTQTVLSGPRKRIALETFEKVRPLLRYMDLIHFTGCGETFLHPRLMEMLAAVPHESCTVRIITNGILLDEATSRHLVELGLQELWVSIDGTDAATFERIRGSKLFDKVINNVRTVTRLRREAGKSRPRVALNFVAQRSNIEQLPQFVRMAKELGADAVNVGFLQVYSKELLTESLYFYQELSDTFMAQAQEVAREVKIDLYVPGFFRNRCPESRESSVASLPTDTFRTKCVEPYGFVLVHADGTLGPCCVNDSRLGSLADDDFITLWNGELYADFRRRVSTPEEDFDCQHCMLEGYKDIHEFEHHAKLFDENYQRADVDYAALERQVRELIARTEEELHAKTS